MSWLKPYVRTWYQRYPEGIPPAAQLARHVKKLLKAHPEERIVAELAAYLAQTPPQFVSVPRFASLFGSWKQPEIRRPHSQSVDEMDRNAGILP